MKTDKHIHCLSINGLEGRVMRMPSDHKKHANNDILLIYGSNSTIERNIGMVEALSVYGNVTMPDLPGFGGMDSLRQIGTRPSIDSISDYLADFVRREYPDSQVKVAGFSLGMLVVVRMLQRHPDLAPRISLLASLAGTTHGSDFVYSPIRRRLFIFGLLLLSYNPINWLVKTAFFNKVVLRRVYAKSYNAKHKFKGLSAEQHAERLETEIDLWHTSDFRTWAITVRQMLGSKAAEMGRVDLPVDHVAITGDNYFDAEVVESNLSRIFKDVHMHYVKLDNHSPSITANKEEVADIIPTALAAKLMLQSDS